MTFHQEQQKKKRNTLLKSYTVEALVSGHTRDKKEVSVTRAGGLQNDSLMQPLQVQGLDGCLQDLA